MKENKLQKISVGIPTFNSSNYLEECLRSLIKQKTIDEILISDDCSKDIELFKIEEIVGKYNKKLPITIYKNPKNQGAFVNKLNLIHASKNKYIYILDSDNIAGRNLDKIVKKYIFTESSNNILFQPNTMFQFWDYPKLSKLLSFFKKSYIVNFFDNDTLLNIDTVKNHLFLNSGEYDLSELKPGIKVPKKLIFNEDILKDKWIFWVLNCGNFIVNKNAMIKIAEQGLKFERSLRSIDAVVFSYLWLINGNIIKIPKKFYHHHRKRENSVSYIEKNDSIIALKYFIKKVLDHE